MKYYNLVYVKHHDTDRRAFLFSLPMDAEIKKGEKLYVRDRLGEHIVTAFRDSFICSEKSTETLCVANGGYFPPADVVGVVSSVTIRQEVVNKFNGESFPTVQKEEVFPW